MSATRRRCCLLVAFAATGSLAASGSASAAGGDACADARVISSLPFTDAGTSCGFANDADNTGAAACGDLPDAYPGPDVFYGLTLGAGNALSFELTMPSGATGDLALFLIRRSTCGDAGQCAAYSIDVRGAGQGPERIRSASYPAGTYDLVVDSVYTSGVAASCGEFSLAVSGSLGAVSGTGGAPGSGGVAGTGGAMGTGGVVGTDGGIGTGGLAGTGGDIGTGGTTVADAGAGGTDGGLGTGGLPGTGGGASGTGGRMDGSIAGDGAAPDTTSDGAQATASSGCGCALPRDGGRTPDTAPLPIIVLAAAIGAVARARRARR
jgi:hypothetical protein